MAGPFITVLDNENQPTGPFSLEEVQQRLRTGEFRPDQLAHAEGLSQWTPLNAVLAFLLPAAVPPAFAVGATLPAFTSVQHIQAYAGFWLRFAAYLIDAVILGAVIYLPMALLLFAANPSGVMHDFTTGSDTAMDSAPEWLKVVFSLYILGIFFTYFPYMESSTKQATIGKMVVNIKVTDLNGQRLSYSHALGRTVAKIVSGLTCCVFYIGYLMAGFTEKKQALHDMIAGTLVLRK